MAPKSSDRRDAVPADVMTRILDFGAQVNMTGELPVLNNVTATVEGAIEV